MPLRPAVHLTMKVSGRARKLLPLPATRYPSTPNRLPTIQLRSCPPPAERRALKAQTGPPLPAAGRLVPRSGCGPGTGVEELAIPAERRTGRRSAQNNPPVRLTPDSPLYTKGPLEVAEEITSNGVCTALWNARKQVLLRPRYTLAPAKGFLRLPVDILRLTESQFQASGIRTSPDQKVYSRLPGCAICQSEETVELFL